MILIDSIIYSLTCVIYLNVPLRYVTYIDYAYAWFISNTKGADLMLRPGSALRIFEICKIILVQGV